MTFADVVTGVMEKHNLSYLKFARGINEYLEPGERYTKQAIKFWKIGGAAPRSYSLLEAIYLRAPDGSWPSEFAIGGMEAMNPDRFYTETSKIKLAVTGQLHSTNAEPTE